jgi:hypothetical protein
MALFPALALDVVLGKDDVFVIQHKLSDIVCPVAANLIMDAKSKFKFGAEFSQTIAEMIRGTVKNTYLDGGEFRASIVNKQNGSIELYLSLVDKNKKAVFISHPWTIGLAPPPKIYKSPGRKKGNG